MPFRFRQGERIADEVRREFDHQLEKAIADLSNPSRPAGRDGNHAARRHVKKARALIRLVRPALGDEFDDADHRLRIVNRMLGPVADACAVIETLDHLQGLDYTRLRPAGVAALRNHLAERASSMNRQAGFELVRERAARLLSEERQQIGQWRLTSCGKSLVIAQTAAAHRAARHAMKKALARPTSAALHRWRRRVKTEWYMVRLIGERCGDRLDGEARRLEALDGCLGELHNIIVLQDLLVDDSPLGRRETADCLRALRSYRRDQIRRARTMGRIHHERPRPFGQRLRELWGLPPAAATRPGDGAGAESSSCAA
jgi:CHAD domain-containing protein